MKGKLAFGESSFNHLYIRYKNSARYRNIPFELTKHDLKALIDLHCHYCNNPPKQVYAYCKGSHGYITYNGIDRINNDIGYVAGNIVPCCYVCNRMKGNMIKQEFLEHIRNVINHTNHVVD